MLFGGGWSFSSTREKNGPRFFPAMPSFHTNPVRRGPDIFRQNLNPPPPPPPLFPSAQNEDTEFRGRIRVKRYGYLQGRPTRWAPVPFGSVERPATDPPRINEPAWEDVCHRVRKAMSEKMKNDCVKVRKMNDERRILSDERAMLAHGFNPYTHLNLQLASFSRKKDSGMGVSVGDGERHDEHHSRHSHHSHRSHHYEDHRSDRSHPYEDRRSVRNSRKLVRSHAEYRDGLPVLTSGVTTEGISYPNKLWMKRPEEEELVRVKPHESSEYVRDVEVTIEESQSSSEVTPPDSPGRVRVVCEEEDVEVMVLEPEEPEIDVLIMDRVFNGKKQYCAKCFGCTSTRWFDEELISAKKLIEDYENKKRKRETEEVVEAEAIDRSISWGRMKDKHHTAPHDRGSMSLRIINGHRVTGNSRECYAHLSNNCQSGIFCRFEHAGSRSHSESKLCARLLRGRCRPDNGDCSSAHSALLPHQFPVCAFFLRGDCSTDNCQLLHVRHSPALPPCKEFVAGACTKGDCCEFPHFYPYEIVRQRGCLSTETPDLTAIPQDEDSTVFPWME